MIFLISLSGCVEPYYHPGEQDTAFRVEPAITASAPSPTIAATFASKSMLLIDNISENLTWFQERKWNTLYQADELDCSRMSTYFWDYIRKNFHVTPKIVIVLGALTHAPIRR